LDYPNGQNETVLTARFNFHWQLGYELEKPIHVPKGTKADRDGSSRQFTATIRIIRMQRSLWSGGTLQHRK
jgi:hypothetical protein